MGTDCIPLLSFIVIFLWIQKLALNARGESNIQKSPDTPNDDIMETNLYLSLLNDSALMQALENEEITPEDFEYEMRSRDNETEEVKYTKLSLI